MRLQGLIQSLQVHRVDIPLKCISVQQRLIAGCHFGFYIVEGLLRKCLGLLYPQFSLPDITLVLIKKGRSIEAPNPIKFNMVLPLRS